MDAALLLVAAIAHVAPEHLARWLGHKVVAWETVMYGVEATALWLACASFALRFRGLKWPVLAVCAYGVMEGLERVICRMALPMDRPLSLTAGKFACDAAGFGQAEISIFALALVALAVSVANATHPVRNDRA